VGAPTADPAGGSRAGGAPPDADPGRPDPDWEALRRVAAGQGEAFSGLVERHQERLLRLAERLLGDAEEARDAVQEVFLRVYRKAASFRPRGQVYTWLYRIAVNHCLNRLRRRRLVHFWRFDSLRSAAGSEPEEPAFDPPDRAPDPEAALAARRRWRATRAALARLPASQRAVVVLARFEGLSYREIAAALGITLGAVESRLFRAMRHLEAAPELSAPEVAPQERALPGVLPTGEDR
jgi:RNA polymerase sigma-70 factor (ECF subfamily)